MTPPHAKHKSIMRLLHTSDWHLGQNFFGLSRQREHQALIDWLIETVPEYQVDAVLIAGDVFDTAAPPSYARALYNQLIVALNKLGCQLWILAGNHDSPAVLNESRQLLAALDTQVVVSPEQAQLHTLYHQGQAQAVLLPMPYIRPRDVLTSTPGAQKAALGEAIVDAYQSRFAKAKASGLPVIATGHLTIMGAEVSDSEREIYIGTLEALPASALPDFDYLAMGHIHRPQIIANKTNWRYSGSPIALSFSEAGQQKSMVLVDTEHLEAPQLIALPTWQPMCHLTTTLADLRQAVQEQIGEQTLWLSLTMKEQRRDLSSQVQQLLSDLPVRVLKISRAVNPSEQVMSEKFHSVQELTPEQVFDERLALEEVSEASAKALRLAYQEILAEVNQ